jgi:hypothetical protein
MDHREMIDAWIGWYVEAIVDSKGIHPGDPSFTEWLNGDRSPNLVNRNEAKVLLTKIDHLDEADALLAELHSLRDHIADFEAERLLNTGPIPITGVAAPPNNRV